MPGVQTRVALHRGTMHAGPPPAGPMYEQMYEAAPAAVGATATLRVPGSMKQDIFSLGSFKWRSAYCPLLLSDQSAIAGRGCRTDVRFVGYFGVLEEPSGASSPCSSVGWCHSEDRSACMQRQRDPLLEEVCQESVPHCQSGFRRPASTGRLLCRAPGDCIRHQH